MKLEKIHEMFRLLREQNPEPKGELNSVNTYTLLVAVILSAQATDLGVNKATEKLFKQVDTPEKMVKLGLEKLKDHIKTIGLYNSKAANIIEMSKLLIKQHNSHVPETLDELTALPGVGRKTANVILNIAFGHSTIAVDTHVFRVANRTGLASGATVEIIEKKLENVIPQEFKRHAHHWLILHGRYICKARKPDCEHCILNKLCKTAFTHERNH
ncbi:MAG: endonuclease III [Alphaproteobacteria bacterium]|nr:endonuclease III [Alphaproteobacteria bacterium]MCB1551788.1 endonuclease III [Alphaproteobacteria bacterium]MCB9984993.1 endonuclease III [Micavibrio sp.]HPQ50289.1 endonuclease III [Alphaproteobacteria bacterium]HRK97384.1 endonuclease III [Alphaproteobacteria bacterium]